MPTDPSAKEDGPISDEEIMILWADTPQEATAPEEIVRFARALLAREGERLLQRAAKSLWAMDELSHLVKVQMVDARDIRRMFGVREKP